MLFLEYLFFKYYNWQVKVGNDNMPSLMSVMFIAFCTEFYVFDIVMFIDFFISEKRINIPLSFFLLLTLIVFIVLYFILVYNGKDELIMEKHKEEWTGEKNWGAILFPSIMFIWFNVNGIVRLLMNQGRI